MQCWSIFLTVFLPYSDPCCSRDAVDTTITDVVYLDVGVCPDGVRADRSLGDKAICTSTQSLGRIIIGEQRQFLPGI